MFPEEFINRILTQKYLDPEGLLKALEDPSPVSIRTNERKWWKKPAGSEPVPWSKNGYYLQSRPSYTLDPLFHSGCYYPQEASSMFLEHIIRQTADPQNDYRVLDLCAAPGGKSTHLSDLIGPGSLLVANETIRARAAILAETISKWGAGNTLVTQNDPSAFGKLKGYFDMIIVDAPCSGEGMFRNEIAVGEWSAGNAVHCSERQKRILMEVWPALKENGLLVYSTCTFNPGENEENVRWLTGKQEAITIRIDVSEFKGIKEIYFDGIYGYGFYPGKVKGEGFFISAIRKTGKQQKTQVKSQIRKELSPGKKDLEIAYKWTHFQQEKIFKWREELFAVPCSMDDYLFLYSHLKIVKAGTKVFIVKNNNYLPTNELVLSALIKKDAFPTSEIDLSQALAFMKRDNFKLQNAPMGWNIVTYKGVNLGFVNNIGNRVNNYFPVEWRIRMDIPKAGNENIISWVKIDKL